MLYFDLVPLSLPEGTCSALVEMTPPGKKEKKGEEKKCKYCIPYKIKYRLSKFKMHKIMWRFNKLRCIVSLSMNDLGIVVVVVAV